MGLTAAEMEQFHREGYVVKAWVFSSADMEPIKGAITRLVDREAR